MKKVFIVFLWMSLTVVMLQAQSRLKRKADALYDKLSYELAIPYYESHLKKNIDGDATLKLADCYRLTHDYQNAAKWYDKVLLLPSYPPIIYFYYGHALLQNGDLEGAKEMFADYAAAVPDDKRGKNFLNAISRRDELLRDSVRIEVSHLPFNCPHAEFGTFPYLEGIVFASAREVGIPVRQAFNWLDTPFLNFFYTAYKKDSAKWSKPDLLEGDVNSKYHESNFTMAAGSDEFYFTRNNFIEKEKGTSNEGVIKLKLYKGKIQGLETTEIIELPFNSDEYSNTHPSISADGNTLYFVSDMPGGVGGKDLYYVTKQGEGWSDPVNLENLNTPGDEVFPYIHPDGTLYFSSDGHPGLGHLDVLYVRLNGDQQVVNIGYPINTAWDDFAFYLGSDNENGFLSSDRLGGEGSDDIYKVHLKRPVLQIYVLDSVAQLPIRNAHVTVRDLTDQSKYEFTTDSTGLVAFKTYFEHQFEIQTETQEFDPRLDTYTLNPSGEEMVFTKEIPLWSPPPAITAIVIDEATKQRIPGAEVEFVSLRVMTKQVRTADMNGRFHIRLEPHTYYEMNVRHPGYLTYSQRVSTTLTAFDGDTIIPLRMEKIVFNKPIRLENIKYDFDKWTIRADAYPDLEYLAELMKKNPTIIVELGSHTDSRGSDKYNEDLAQKRANAARIHLIDLGVDPARIKAKGYGEYKLSNCCFDGEPCAEEEHQRNRRTEFKIIGTIDGIDMQNSTLETNEAGDFKPEDCPKGKVKVAPKPLEPSTRPGIAPPIDKPKRDTMAAVSPTPKPVVASQPTPKPVVASEPAPKPIVATEPAPKPVVAPEPTPKPVVVATKPQPRPIVTTEPEPRANPEDEDNIIYVRSGDPAMVSVRDSVVQIQRKGNPAVAAVDTVQKGNRPQPVTPAPQPKQDSVFAAREKPEPIPAPQPKQDSVFATREKPEPIPAPILKRDGDDFPTEKRDSNSVATWLGDSDPVGNQGDTGSVETPAPAQNIAWTTPAFKANERPKDVGDSLTFRIQIGAFKGELSEENRQKVGDLAPYIFAEPDPDGPARTYIGEYFSKDDVKKALQQVQKAGYPNAFITAFRGGKELSIGEVRLILHETRRI